VSYRVSSWHRCLLVSLRCLSGVSWCLLVSSELAVFLLETVLKRWRTPPDTLPIYPDYIGFSEFPMFIFSLFFLMFVSGLWFFSLSLPTCPFQSSYAKCCYSVFSSLLNFLPVSLVNNNQYSLFWSTSFSRILELNHFSNSLYLERLSHSLRAIIQTLYIVPT